MADKTGIVTASSLNVRPEPSTEKPPVGQLRRGSEVEILEQVGNWYRINSGDLSGFVSGDFLTLKDETPGADFLYEIPLIQTALLEPGENEKISFDGDPNSTAAVVAATWNQYGGLLSTLSDTIDIDPGCATAVLCVESNGKGFGPNGRMIIRFENHIFWRQWGKTNPQTFTVHFRFDQQKPWQGHEFRENENDEWMPFHGNQSEEWQVFEFAGGLNESAAMCSISMGGPQIMGFNHAAIGYDSVAEMFENFQKDIRYQIIGLFDFLRGAGTTSPMIQDLQRKKFENFASRYNGTGQAAKYGALIERYFDTYSQLRG